MELYELHLAQSSTMTRITVKSTTIKNYLETVSSVSLRHKLLESLLKNCVLKAHCIKEVLSEVKRWKSMPNSREAVIVKMVLHMREKFKNKYHGIIESILSPI